MNEKQDIQKFALVDIEDQLKAKLYKKRGLTREEYIRKCEALWNNAPEFNPDWQEKIIIDYLGATIAEDLVIINGFGLEYADNRLKNIIKKQIEGKTDLVCSVVGYREEKDGQINQIRKRKYFESSFLDKPEIPEPSSYFVGRFYLLEYEKLKRTFPVDLLKNKYKKILHTVREWNDGETTEKKEKVDLQISLSRSVVSLWCEGKPENLQGLTEACADFLVESLHEGLAFVGAIAAGEGIVHFSSNTFKGDFVLEADRFLQYQNWVGATFCNSVVLPYFMTNSKNKPIQKLKANLIVPNFFDHLEPLKIQYYPFISIDLRTRWKFRYPKENLNKKLAALSEDLPADRRNHYKNTLNFLNFSKKFSLANRRMLINGTFDTFVLPKEGAIGMTKSEIHKFPLVVKLKNGLFYFGFLLGNSEKKINPAIKKCLTKDFLFVDFLLEDQVNNFLTAKVLDLNAEIKKGTIRIFKPHTIESFSFFHSKI